MREISGTNSMQTFVLLQYMYRYMKIKLLKIEGF